MASALDSATDVSADAPNRAREQRRFVVRAALWMIVLYVVYYYPYSEASPPGRAIQLYLCALAELVASFLKTLGESVHVQGSSLEARFPLQIVKSCSALDAQALYVAALLAFPAKPRLKLVGIAAGVAGLTALNVLRIVALYYVGLTAGSAFERVHEELMPLLLVACACLGFLLWTRWAQRVH